MTRIIENPEPPSMRRNSSIATTVAIASRRPELTHALRARIAIESDLILIRDSVKNRSQLFSYLNRWQPNLLLLERRFLNRQDAQPTEPIHSVFPHLSVLLICDRASPGLVEMIVRNHFHGFLLTSCATDTCVKAIRTVSRGEMWLPRAMLEKTIFESAHAVDHDDAKVFTEPKLTRREAQAVEYLCKGFTNKQIGGKLGIREDTVKKHLHSVYGKLGVHCRTQLMAHQADRQLRNALLHAQQ